MMKTAALLLCGIVTLVGTGCHCMRDCWRARHNQCGCDNDIDFDDDNGYNMYGQPSCGCQQSYPAPYPAMPGQYEMTPTPQFAPQPDPTFSPQGAVPGQQTSYYPSLPPVPPAMHQPPQVITAPVNQSRLTPVQPRY